MGGKCAFLFVVAITLVGVVNAGSGNVEDYNDETFFAGIGQKPAFIEFYAPWCGHCRRLAPTWVRFAKGVEEYSITIGKVDCTTAPKLCAQFGIQSYPTIILLMDQRYKAEFRNHRKPAFMLQFLNLHGALIPDTPPESDLVLRSYDSRSNAGETVRLILETLQVPYSQIRYSQDDWKTHREELIQNGTAPFGTLPVLSVTADTHISSLPAIARHLSRYHDKLDGAVEQDYTRMDIISAAAQGLISTLDKFMYSVKSPEMYQSKLSMYLQNLDRIMYLRGLEKHMETMGTARYITGDKLVWVDLYLWQALHLQVQLGEDTIKTYQRLTAFYHDVEFHEPIVAYVKSDRVPKMCFGDKQSVVSAA